MSREEFKALFSSLARIEMLIKTIMVDKYGEKATNKVYSEVVELIDKEVSKIFDEEG